LLNSEVKPLISKLCSDTEFDVRFFADEARDVLGL